MADRLASAPVDEKPMEKAVGLDLVFAEVGKWLEDEKVGIIDYMEWGVWGKPPS